MKGANPLKGLQYVIAFLTIIPAEGGSLEETAQHSYFFPLIGAFLGFVTYAFSFVTMKVIPQSIAVVMAFGFLMGLTGLHHTDGLLDIGDALMVTGSKKRKVEVMHDRALGIGGLFLAYFVMTATVVSLLESAKMGILFLALIGSEISAKFSMNCVLYFGKPSHKGMGSTFAQYMDLRNFLKSALISLTFFSFFLEIGVFLFGLTVLSSFLLSIVAERNFGGIGGDFLGATNDIMRVVSIICIISVSPWM